MCWKSAIFLLKFSNLFCWIFCAGSVSKNLVCRQCDNVQLQSRTTSTIVFNIFLEYIAAAEVYLYFFVMLSRNDIFLKSAVTVITISWEVVDRFANFFKRFSNLELLSGSLFINKCLADLQILYNNNACTTKNPIDKCSAKPPNKERFHWFSPEDGNNRYRNVGTNRKPFSF